MLAVPADALVQRLDKILVAPRTNAGVLVGCDVRNTDLYFSSSLDFDIRTNKTRASRYIRIFA